MIKDVKQAIKDYCKAREHATTTYNQAVKYVNDNYIKDSEVYKDTMKTVQVAFDEAVRPLKGDYSAKVAKAFEEVKQAVQGVVAVPPTTEVLNMIEAIKSGTINDTEKEMILNQFGTNYMNSKLLHNAFGEHFTTVEDVVQRITDLEDMVVKYPHYLEDGESEYYVRLLENDYDDSWILNVDRMAEEFIQSYTVQEGGEQ